MFVQVRVGFASIRQTLEQLVKALEIFKQGDYSRWIMTEKNEKIPSPKEIEREIGQFLAKRFGGTVRMVTPEALSLPQPDDEVQVRPESKSGEIKFDLKPEELIAYLDQYVIKQDHAKAILATKICTHFNRVKHESLSGETPDELTGRIKNNVLMIGPTGVGKTYMVKLIAKKIGVPFVKGDATKFSETGYVGGDVEDLVRDLVREADDDLQLAQYGIIYIDEIDKIAGSRTFIGADVSRAGVQRALLKPMEETEVDLKVPHDPISLLQEIERFRKTGKRDKRILNTRNILFIMSGAFGDLSDIIRRRTVDQRMGFGADVHRPNTDFAFLKHVKSEDLIEFGFESEFVGRLPVKSVFSELAEADLYAILKNPNNPVILGKKRDFAAYNIDIRFEDAVLKMLAARAFQENTGARGLVSAIEEALLPFEKHLPSTAVRQFPVTQDLLAHPEALLGETTPETQVQLDAAFDTLVAHERQYIKDYLKENRNRLVEKFSLTLTPARMDVVADYYVSHIMDVGSVVRKVKYFYDEAKKLELIFYKTHDMNIVLEDDAVDFIIEQFANANVTAEDIQRHLTRDFELGLRLIQEKTGRNRFFISRQALLEPDDYISHLIKTELQHAKEDHAIS